MFIAQYIAHNIAHTSSLHRDGRSASQPVCTARAGGFIPTARSIERSYLGAGHQEEELCEGETIGGRGWMYQYAYRNRSVSGGMKL